LRPIYLLNEFQKKKTPSEHILDQKDQKIEEDEIMRLSIVGRFDFTFLMSKNKCWKSILKFHSTHQSTLFNKLIGNDRVVVSEVAGTTRDTIQLKCLKPNSNQNRYV
jgi:predicted GTPase